MATLQWPIAYRKHIYAKGVPRWPSFDRWEGWAEQYRILCFYTILHDVMYEISNINDPRNPDLEDKSFFIHIIPDDEFGIRELVYVEPNLVVDHKHELSEKFAFLRSHVLPDIANETSLP